REGHELQNRLGGGRKPFSSASRSTARSITPAKVSRQWSANASSHAFHSGVPFSATTFPFGPPAFGRPGFRCFFSGMSPPSSWVTDSLGAAPGVTVGTSGSRDDRSYTIIPRREPSKTWCVTFLSYSKIALDWRRFDAIL